MESGGRAAGRGRHRRLSRHHALGEGRLPCTSPRRPGISHLTAYGATAAVSLGAAGLVSVEGCGLFTYVHTVRENQMTYRHNLPASYCLEVGL